MRSAASIPCRVLLFSGHMIDAPGREAPRFPPAMEATAREAIERRLDAIGACRGDLAVCSGACGGDLLFAEAALARSVTLEVYLPLEVESFAAGSVEFAGGDWRARFDAVLAKCTLHLMPAERLPLSKGQNAYEQTNLWMLESASRFGANKVVFIALWDGQLGDGPGGTKHMMDTVRGHRGDVHWIDTHQLST